MSLQLTNNAVQHISKMLDKRGHGIGLRLATKQYGCSGFGYEVDYADEIGDDDEVIESGGVKVLVKRDSLHLLEGTTIDYVRTNALNEGFEFINPNVKDLCGCGESFTV
jgi:iron-sulfur cluster assembly protein